MRHSRADAVRITSASRPHSEDVRGRTRRYLISMGIRTVCFLLSVLTIGHWFMWVFLVGALVLPYVAVVMANTGAGPDPDGPYQGYDRDLRALQDRSAETPEQRLGDVPPDGSADRPGDRPGDLPGDWPGSPPGDR